MEKPVDEHEQRAILRALDRLPADQRRAAARALLRLSGHGPVSRARALEVLGDLVKAQARTNARRVSDARTDSTRRTLIGARVPRADADRYRAAAAEEGVSLYAWTVAALNAHADRLRDRADAASRSRRKRRDQEQPPKRYRPPRRGT